MKLTGKTEVLGGKRVPLPPFSPHIPHELAWHRNRAFDVTARLIACLLYGIIRNVWKQSAYNVFSG